MPLWIFFAAGVVVPGAAALWGLPWLVGQGLDPDLAAGGILSVSAALAVGGWLGARSGARARVAALARGLDNMVSGRPPEALPVEHSAVWDHLRTVLAQLEVAGQAVLDRRALQEVIDSMPDSLLVLDVNGVAELCNRTYAQRMGYDSSADVVGLSLEALVGEPRPGWYALLGDTGEVVAQDVHFRARDGGSVLLKTSGQLLRGPDGDRRGVVLVARETGEISRLTHELQRAEERLEDSERFFQDLFDAMEDPITVLSPELDILQANRQARMVFGKDVIGRKCYRAFRMQDAPCPDCPARETFAQDRTTTVEHRIFGNAITRITTYPLLSKDGRFKAVINHKRDVTKERQLEDLKASFLAAVSHELRTPLTSIMGFNKLNLRRLTRYVRPILAEAPEEARSALQKALSDMEVMASEGERLGRLVNDVLDLSKLEAGKLRMNFEALDVAAVVAAAIQTTSTLHQGRHILLVPDLPAACPPAWGDRDRVAQVLVNLLSNAIKYTERGEIRVQITADPLELTVAVQDAGAGIPPEELPYIFERFRQAGEAQKGRPAGTGLGLPICREIVKQHRGRIWVESAPGQGSTFAFTVLRADAVDAHQRALDEAPANSQPG